MQFQVWVSPRNSIQDNCFATSWNQASHNENSQHLKQALCHRNPPAIFSSAAKTVLLQEGHSDDIFVCRTILNPKDGDHESLSLSVFCSSNKFYLNLFSSIVLRWLTEGTFNLRPLAAFHVRPDINMPAPPTRAFPPRDFYKLSARTKIIFQTPIEH